jgi:hypothetical protein
VRIPLVVGSVNVHRLRSTRSSRNVGSKFLLHGVISGSNAHQGRRYRDRWRALLGATGGPVDCRLSTLSSNGRTLSCTSSSTERPPRCVVQRHQLHREQSAVSSISWKGQGSSGRGHRRGCQAIDLERHQRHFSNGRLSKPTPGNSGCVLHGVIGESTRHGRCSMPWITPTTSSSLMHLREGAAVCGTTSSAEPPPVGVARRRQRVRRRSVIDIVARAECVQGGIRSVLRDPRWLASCRAVSTRCLPVDKRKVPLILA